MKRLLVPIVVVISGFRLAVPSAGAGDPELDRLEQRILDDDRILDRERIWVTGIARREDRLDLDVISPRADVRTFMRDRYAPSIATVKVIAKRRYYRQRKS